MRRLAPSLLALTLAALVAAGQAAGAAGDDAPIPWRVSATVTGTYENATGWVNCNATGQSALVREQARVDATLRPRFTALFYRRTGMVARFRATAGGSWTLTGSYPPISYSPSGEPTCGPQVPIACAGPVVGRSRNGELDFGVRGRRAIGYFRLVPEIVESARYAQPDPAKPFCSESEEGETSRVVPLFGLGGTSLAARAFPTPNTFPARVPVAKLLGRKRFAVVLPPAKLEGCPEDFYSTCQESGQIRMRLVFTPARR